MAGLEEKGKTFGRYVDQLVADDINTERNIEPQRVNGTVLYIFHNRFSEVLDKLGPDLGRQEINTRFSVMIDEATKSGGNPEQLDPLRAAMFVAFNYPSKDLNHRENALIAAANMRSSLIKLNKGFATRAIEPKFGIGIATGEFDAGGDLGNQARVINASTGRPLVDAAKLAINAEVAPYKVLVGESFFKGVNPVLQKLLDRWIMVDSMIGMSYGLLEARDLVT